jgi:8-oxo-dGTP pyrophosphatase MutT (NUDIX family)
MSEQIAYIEKIRNSILIIRDLNILQLDGIRSAAVLVPLVLENGQWKLIFIHRSEAGRLHSGEVSFPGGAMEPTDKDLVDTALRETKEEIGIPPDTVEVLGFLPPLISATNFHVTPIVGLVQWPQMLTLDQHEVMRAFTIEIDWLSDLENWQEREVDLPVRGKVKSIFYNEYKGEILWGLTARMTQNFLHRI